MCNGNKWHVVGDVTFNPFGAPKPLPILPSIEVFFSPKRVSSSEGVSPVNNPVTWVHAEWYSPVDEGILWRNFQTYLRLSICLTLSLAGIS